MADNAPEPAGEDVPLSVALTSPYSLRIVTGIGEFLTELSRSLRSRSWKATLIVPDTRDRVALPFSQDDNIREVPTNRWRQYRDMFLSLHTASLVLSLRKNIDVLHAQQAHPQTVAVIIAGKIIGRRTVTTLHLLPPRPKTAIRLHALRFVERFVLRYSDEVVFVSRRTKETFGPSRGIVVHNGVDFHRFAPDAKLRRGQRESLGIRDEVLVLYLGRWAEIKGVREMLEAISKTCKTGDRRIRFAMVGGGTEEERTFVENEVARRDLGNVVALSWMDPDRIPWLQGADVFILPSHDEGLPLSLLEAMSIGLPCIVTPVGGVREIVEPGIDALVVPTYDPDAMSAAILRCVDDSGLRSYLGANARRKVVDVLGLDRMVNEYRCVYNRLVPRGNGTSRRDRPNPPAS